jgi:hypothetical protein
MSTTISTPNLQETDALLSDFLKDVEEAEQSDVDFSGGTKQALGSEAIKSLQQSQVLFGNPTDRLILLCEESFKESGSELNNIYRQ